MIQSEVILNFGIKDDWSECGWLTLQWMLKETIAAAYCSSCSRKDLMTVFLEQLKYLNEACVINLSGSSTVYYNFFEVRKPNKSITKFLFLQRISWEGGMTKNGSLCIVVINKALVEVTMPEEWRRREGG